MPHTSFRPIMPVPAHGKQCPKCRQFIDARASICPFCRSKLKSGCSTMFLLILAILGIFTCTCVITPIVGTIAGTRGRRDLPESPTVAATIPAEKLEAERRAAAAKQEAAKQEAEKTRLAAEARQLELKTIMSKVRELPSYAHLGSTWRSVVIPVNTTRETLIIIARELHRLHPDSPIYIFDDDAKFEQFRLSMQHDSKPEEDQYPFPEQWVREHYLATIIRYFSRGGWDPWVLDAEYAGIKYLPERSKSGTIVDLESSP